MTSLELAVRFGKTLIIQEMDGVEPVLYPLLRRDLIAQGIHTLTNTISIQRKGGKKNDFDLLSGFTNLSLLTKKQTTRLCLTATFRNYSEIPF